MFAMMETTRLESLHFAQDPPTGLKAIIAIHNSRLGPALGGCRYLSYVDEQSAILDALRLAKGMSYKAALAGVAHGGGKAVIMRPAHVDNRGALFEAFGRFIETLNGHYITAMDSGTSSADMDCIAQQWWASATPLTNLGITRDGNLQLFLNGVSDEDGQPLEVYWDEYFHGRHGSLWSYVRQTPVFWGLLQACCLVLAALFSFSRRSGPVAAPPTVSRLSPLEFVDTMGSLYQRAGAASIAVDTSYRHLRLELARRLRLPTNATNAALARGRTECVKQALVVNGLELPVHDRFDIETRWCVSNQLIE
jgi:hypothetical protein